MGLPNLRTPNINILYILSGALVALLLHAAGSVSRACDTPVYRYAMYRWYPAPYEVYFFFEGEMDASGEEMKQAIDEAANSEKTPANIVFIPVNLTEDKELKGVPPDVKEAWEKQKEPKTPQFLVSSPVGGHLFMGDLETDQLSAMIDSPMRQQIGDEMKEGKAGVYVLLEGEDDKANAAAQKTLQGVVDDVASGKIQLYTMPPAYGAYGPSPAEESSKPESGKAKTEEAEDKEPRLSIGLLTLARDNPKEKWFIDTLLAMEPDLPESKEPIVFMIYGRGRALFSCLGEGIRRDNLVMDVEFITGACSCTVKNMNPGVDLLMSYNWDAAAEVLYQQHGLEEGSPYGSGGAPQQYPELMVPSGAGTATDEAGTDESTGTTGTEEESGSESGEAVESDTEDDAAATETMVAQVDPAVAANLADAGKTAKKTAAVATEPPPTIDSDAAPVSTDKEAGSDSESTAKTEVAANTPPARTARSASEDSTAEPASSSFHSFQGILWIGGGLLGVLAVLFGLTFVVLRPK